MMVVAAAGNVDHDDVVRLVRQGVRARRLPRRRRGACRAPRRAAAAAGVDAGEVARRPRPFEQVNVVLGDAAAARSTSAATRSGAQRRARRRHVVAAVPGGARAAGAGLLGLLLRPGYSDAGMVGVAAGCCPAKAGESRVVRAELADVADSRAHRGGARPRQGPDARRARARPRGQRLADDPARQGGAGHGRLLLDRRDPRTLRRRHRATRCTRWRAELFAAPAAPWPSVGPFD